MSKAVSRRPASPEWLGTKELLRSGSIMRTHPYASLQRILLPVSQTMRNEIGIMPRSITASGSKEIGVSTITVRSLLPTYYRARLTETPVESVIWFGDFNYRIGLNLETAKDLVRKGALAELYANDQVCLPSSVPSSVVTDLLQLNLQMVAGYAFHYYSEALITFNPTYKYDIGTDTFDTS